MMLCLLHVCVVTYEPLLVKYREDNSVLENKLRHYREKFPFDANHFDPNEELLLQLTRPGSANTGKAYVAQEVPEKPITLH